jgi:hypothetical protein
MGVVISEMYKLDISTRNAADPGQVPHGSTPYVRK